MCALIGGGRVGITARDQSLRSTAAGAQRCDDTPASGRSRALMEVLSVLMYTVPGILSLHYSHLYYLLG